MQGLSLCEKYFNEVGLPVLEKECGGLIDRMAFGLVGDGSECYGFDDKMSQDHDWGAGFCIWLDKEDYDKAGKKIQAAYDSLPTDLPEFGSRLTSQWGQGRVGVLEIGSFYKRFIGREGPPQSLKEWLFIPDNALAAATNGKVFQDTPGYFSSIRESLLEHYPEDIRLKKIASRCMTAGQAGQYNFNRAVKRGEAYAAGHSEIKFCFEAMSLIFLINKKYAPFYKWLHRAVRDLSVMGEYMYGGIKKLLEERDPSSKSELIESISQELISELKSQGMSGKDSDYLPEHGPEIQKLINDPEMKFMDVWIG